MGEIERALIENDYRIAGDRPVAYLDESYSTPTQKGENFYILTAVIVAQPARDALRKGIEVIADGDYWHTTEVLQKPDGVAWAHDMLTYLCEGQEVCVVALNEAVSADDKDGEVARQNCFERLLPSLEKGGTDHESVKLAILETRRERKQRNHDDYMFNQMIKGGLLSESFRLRQASPADEHLLWLPDTVCSAVRRSVASKKTDLFSAIESSVVWA